MLSHGTAPAGLLLSTLVPLIKNKRGNKCDSNNYRAIAISSIMGKLFDTVLLKLQHASLFTDSLQFDFKPNSSTVIRLAKLGQIQGGCRGPSKGGLQ